MNSQLKQSSWEHVVIPMCCSNAIDEPPEMPPDLIYPPWLIRPLKQRSPLQLSPSAAWNLWLNREFVQGGNTNRRHKTPSRVLQRPTCMFVVVWCVVFLHMTVVTLCRSTMGCLTYSWLIQGVLRLLDRCCGWFTFSQIHPPVTQCAAALTNSCKVHNWHKGLRILAINVWNTKNGDFHST